ncbi:hypothetical protein CCMSSC00406_0008360 [Pleurotus cornucopiae]|uniref:Uncharacterized protein n=1 Tax=Pleurotus cornucopiae TaxID=5321 RepID=A0ACB7J5I0_PLECO|nr:hypothetical protein CCMSSC00406_0008360 [Pleurotus cornucopiae]
MNVEDLRSMVDDVSEKSAAEIWKQLSDTYIHRDEMRKNYADLAFKNLCFDPNNGQMLAEFFKDLKVKRKEAMDYGNQYTDIDFRGTIVNSLPGKEFDMMLQAFSGILVPANLMQQIELYYSRVEGRLKTVVTKPQQLLQADSSTPSSTIQALQARIAQLESGRKRKKDDRVCTNCNKKNHLVEDCFRPGGGKAGQWPDWWTGKREGGNPPASNLAVASSSVASLSQHYALSADRAEHSSENVPDCLGGPAPNGGEDVDVGPWNDPGSPEIVANMGSSKWSEDSFEEIWAGTSPKWKDIPCADRIVLLNATIGIIEAKNFVMTVLDSSATDHFIMNRDLFETYESIAPTLGSGSKKGSRFTIIGKGRVRKTFIVNGEERTITFDALHTPDVTSDLISVSELDAKGLTVIFSKGLGRVYDKDDKLILTTTKVNELYIFEVKNPAANAAARSLEKPVTMDGWHRQYGHAGIDRIQQLFAKDLVDGAKVEGKVSTDKCVPCVHGKCKGNLKMADSASLAEGESKDNE